MHWLSFFNIPKKYEKMPFIFLNRNEMCIIYYYFAIIIVIRWKKQNINNNYELHIIIIFYKNVCRTQTLFWDNIKCLSNDKARKSFIPKSIVSCARARAGTELWFIQVTGFIVRRFPLRFFRCSFLNIILRISVVPIITI